MTGGTPFYCIFGTLSVQNVNACCKVTVYVYISYVYVRRLSLIQVTHTPPPPLLLHAGCACFHVDAPCYCPRLTYIPSYTRRRPNVVLMVVLLRRWQNIESKFYVCCDVFVKAFGWGGGGGGVAPIGIHTCTCQCFLFFITLMSPGNYM